MACARDALLPLLLAGCASSSGWSPLDRTQLPSRADQPNADAVILEFSRKVRFHLVDGAPVADTTVHSQVLVLTEDGRSWGALRAPYSGSFSEIVDAAARCIRPDGEVEVFDRSEMVDVMSSSYALYQDDRILVKDHPTAPVGSVLEYRYTERHFNPKIFQFGQWFAWTVPAKRTELVVEIPMDWEIDYVTTEYWEPRRFEPQVQEEAGLRRYIWRVEDTPALAEERLAPGRFHRALRVTTRLKSWRIDGERVESFADIRDFSRFLHRLQKGTADPTPEIEKTVARVLEGTADDPREKARRLYEWVQSNVRYVAIEVGMGGWKPYSAGEVFETKYGDCKDKATLLKSMLSVAGIQSHLASLYSHRGFPRKFVLPTFGNTNHAILVVDLPGGERIIADPTERTVPFGAIPLRDQEAELLMITEEGAEPFVTPATGPDQHTKRVDLSLSIDGSGNASGTYRMVTTGDFAWNLKRALMEASKKDRKNRARDWLLLEKGSVDSIDFDLGSTEKSEDMIVTAEGDLVVPQVVSSSGKLRVLRLNEVVATPGGSLREQQRTSPVVFRKRERRDLVVTFSAPEGSRWAAIPEPVSLESPFGTFSLDYEETQEGQLEVRSSFVRSERIIPVEQYSELKSFLDGVRAASARGIVIKEK